ncbi:MAG: diaminopropionate ammonia-lyase [Deltaproteobacteria bacterium]|nr:diaminopropionate ammonia-lyase [Deltaproteobacteria bacterium]
MGFLTNRNLKKPGQGTDITFLSRQEAETARAYHQSFSQYVPTPLTELPNLARVLKVGRIFVKDESYRFGLNAFKVLGASYAIGRYLAEKLGKDISEVSFDMLRSPEVQQQLGQITFTTATDGNHGRAVAWAAQQLGHKAVIYMPKGSDPARLANIRAHGAEATITDLNYDDAVRLSYKMAQEHGWVIVQDTAWEGYEDIPTWIMQGYATLALESLEQLRAQGIDRPTHLFLQAGVGSYAGGVLGFLTSELGENRPITTIVEPDQADCIFRSAQAGDGAPHKVGGDLNTLMAGLACGEPNTISWKILRDYAHGYISCPDWVAANGMRILAAPVRGDSSIVSGESGAVTTGILEYIMNHSEGDSIRKALHLDENSTVLLISTEGDTSPKTYREIVWYGRSS